MKNLTLIFVFTLISLFSFTQNLVFYFSVDGISDTRSTTFFIAGSVLGDINIRPQSEFTIDSVRYVNNGFSQVSNVTYKRKNGADEYVLFNINELTTDNVEMYDLMLINPETYYYLKINVTETASISEIDNDEIKVYPNPVKNVLTIQFQNEIHEDVVTIYSVSGKNVLQEKINIQNNQIHLNTSDLKSGIYFVEVGSARMKIVIE